MTILTGVMNDTITVWAPSTIDEFGDVSFSAPTQITGRWQDKSELAFSGDGQEFQSSSIIYTETVVAFASYVYLGTSVAADPTTVTGSKIVKAVQQAKSLRADETHYKVFL